jgi:hypothetical protein
MEHDAFASLAVLQLSSPCRLLPLACCPDKDLVVLVSRLGGRDRLTLWKMQGTKKWDIDVECDESSTESVSALAWSPCGTVIRHRLCDVISNIIYYRPDNCCLSWVFSRYTSFCARWSYRAFSHNPGIIAQFRETASNNWSLVVPGLSRFTKKYDPRYLQEK